MINLTNFSEQIFKTLKSHGLALKLFTDEGKSTIDPTNACRFYIPKIKMMVNFNPSESQPNLKVNISKGTDVTSIKPILDSIRQLASSNLVAYTLRTFGKEITPKDFAYQAVQAANMKESMSRAFGSKKSSYQQLENAKMIIRHRKVVDEEVRGSRSRNIGAIFIESGDGERFKLPHNNLSAGRALLRHVKEGGLPYDNIGQRIISLSEEYAELQKFRRYAKQNSLISEDQADIVENVATQIGNIRTTLKSISGPKGYAKFVEGYTDSPEALDEDNVDSLKDKFTVRTFDENISSSLPYVAKLVKQVSESKERLGRFKTLANKVIASEGIALREPLCNEDPDSPDNMQFENNIQRLSELSGYLSKYVEDTSLQGMLESLGEDIYNMESSHQTMAEKLLTYISNNAMVMEKESVIAESMDRHAVLSLHAVLNKFGIKNLL